MHPTAVRDRDSTAYFGGVKFKNNKNWSLPTAVTPAYVYSLALEVLSSDVVLVRKLRVPPLALDPTPYGVDRAAVALTLPLDARCCLSHCLRAVHDTCVCRRGAVLFS